MKSFLIFLTTLISFSAMANNVEQCLQTATNNQLLKELKVRLDAGGTIATDYAFPTISCFGSTLTIRLLNKAGKESSQDVSTSSANNCETYATQMTNKLGSKVVEPQIVAVCFGSTLERQLLSPDGSIQELSSMNLSSATNCHKKATEINQQ